MIGSSTETAETAVSRPLWLKNNWGLLGLLIIMLILPFIVALFDGQSVTAVLASQTGNAKFVQGLLVEVFILAIYAISYDLVLGVTGLLSFGHAMFFATGAYFTGIAFKSLGWGLGQTLLGLAAVAVVQALLFGIVLPRVKGITFALVTLGLASVFYIIIQTNELSAWTGADVGLQGVVAPGFLNTTAERYRFYVISLLAIFFVYLIYRRFVDSPTGRVCVAIRENENRALMLGYNTFYFKLATLLLSSFTAVLAGFLHTLHHGARSLTLETPGGMVDPGETPAEAAVRELLEETGYAPGEVVPLGGVNPNPAIFRNRLHGFLVRDARRVAEVRNESTEETHVERVPLRELGEHARAGKIDHALVLAVAYLYELNERG